MKEETAMDKIATAMAEHICGDLCRHPYGKSQGELEDICDECGLGQCVCNILNEYNGLFEELKRSHKNAQELAGELLREKDKQQWIPVSERLPELRRSVLAIDGEGGMCVDFLEKQGMWFWGQENDSGVIAWMSLPEVYQPEDTK